MRTDLLQACPSARLCQRRQITLMNVSHKTVDPSRRAQERCALIGGFCGTLESLLLVSSRVRHAFLAYPYSLFPSLRETVKLCHHRQTRRSKQAYIALEHAAELVGFRADSQRKNAKKRQKCKKGVDSLFSRNVLSFSLYALV